MGLTKKRAFVTGAGGFVGHHLVRRLTMLGWDVTALTRTPLLKSPRYASASGSVPHEVSVDPNSNGDLGQVLSRGNFDCVFHLASVGVKFSFNDETALFEGNSRFGLRLAQACRDSKIPKIVWVGSGFEYDLSGHHPLDEKTPCYPINFYAASKLAGWLLARETLRDTSTDLSTARIFSTYGPGESMSRLIPHIITAALRDRPIEMTEGLQVRDYVYVEDVVDALVMISAEGVLKNEVVNIGSGHPLSLRETAQMIIHQSDSKSELKFGARKVSRREPQYMVANTTLAKAMGWTPQVSLTEGLAQTIDWYRANPTVWETL